MFAALKFNKETLDPNLSAGSAASTSLVIVTLTSAVALVAGEQLAGPRADADPIRALFTLTLMVGVIVFVLAHSS